jgi:pimeloyl-ACP methyl ester carboxylesterase
MPPLRKVFLIAALMLAPQLAGAQSTAAPAVQSKFATVDGVKLHYLNDFAADPNHSVSELDRQFYAKAYAQPGAMSAGFETFHAFEQDAKDFEALSATKLTMPMLVLTGEKASGNGLIDQARLVATNVRGVVVPGSGHWLMEEAPQIVIPELVTFLNAPSGQ